MIKLKPIALAVMGCGLLQGCGAPPPSRPLAVQPVVRGEMPGNQAASWNRLARFHHERGQLALALGAYAQSLALDSNQLEARNAVAVIEAQQGNLESARRALVALVNDYPGEAQPHTNLGYVQYLMGDNAGASQTLRRAMALGAGPKAFQNLQLAEAAMGKTPTADDVQLAATKAAPRAATQPASAEAPATAPSVVAAAAPSVTATARPVVAAPAPAAAPAVLANAVTAAATAAAASAEASPVLPASPARATAAPLAAAPLSSAKPDLAMALPEKPSVARSAPEQLTVLPSSREIASHMELVKLNANVYELRARVATDPVAVAPAGAPVVAAVAPKPAVPAVAQADKVRMARLEVANGNGVTGMARRFRRLLGQIGIPVDRLSNDKPYKQVATTIQYSPGFEKQAASLQKALQGKAQLASKQLAASDVRLVLGKDAQVSLTAVTEAAGLSLVAMQEDGQR
jgi:tetratricopeptide (TPR) repeat protein